MQKYLILYFCALNKFLFLLKTNSLPPKANKIPKELTIHGDVRVDDYYWLNERENPEVIDYLNRNRSERKEKLL